MATFKVVEVPIRLTLIPDRFPLVKVSATAHRFVCEVSCDLRSSYNSTPVVVYAPRRADSQTPLGRHFPATSNRWGTGMRDWAGVKLSGWPGRPCHGELPRWKEGDDLKPHRTRWRRIPVADFEGLAIGKVRRSDGVLQRSGYEDSGGLDVNDRFTLLQVVELGAPKGPARIHLVHPDDARGVWP